ncbi:MAG: Asp-tRNA(Asn)/Glu-tRNA(Gln) amidotransferase subunit GatB, partial [Burkholderiales bacterium]
EGANGENPATTKRINLTRAHLEEDAGKSLHEGLETPGVSGIDLNRAGTPLLEIVSEPEMRSAVEAVAYAKALHGIVTWIGICDGNMQEGSFRCDANVSVRKPSEPLGTRCEIKNVNSFRFLERAINYEVRRQIELIEDGGKVIQQTRLYDAERDETRAMRSKEDAMDYRYFPDPDLLPLVISEKQITDAKLTMPELPSDRIRRYRAKNVDASDDVLLHDSMDETIDGAARKMGARAAPMFIKEQDALALVSSKSLSDYFDSTIAIRGVDWQLAANWVLGEVSAKFNESAIDPSNSPVSGEMLAALLVRIADGTLSSKMAKEVFGYMWAGEHGGDADAIIEVRGLKQVTDPGAIEKIIDDVLAKNEKSVAEFRSGKDKAIQALIGQVMKASQGKANPGQVNELLRKKLAE